MAEAQLIHGNPRSVNYTPTGGNLAAGLIVLVGNTTGWTNGIAIGDITNNTLGALAAGGGTYDVKVASNYAIGSKVYWDDANSVLTTTSTNMSFFGWTEEAASAANDVVLVFHWPYV